MKKIRLLEERSSWAGMIVPIQVVIAPESIAGLNAGVSNFQTYCVLSANDILSNNGDYVKYMNTPLANLQIHDCRWKLKTR